MTITANATAGDDAITLTFGGTPTAAFTETFDIEIPASILTGGKGLLVTENPDARWDINADDETASYTITAQANKGGTITPSGKVTVRSGASQKFTMQADAGYRIADIAVDGKSIGKESSYTFNNVTANHSITASFEKVADTVTVTLDANGGELKGQASIDVVKGGPLGEIAAPTRALHIFIGWYTRKSGGEQVTAETVINQSMTIYAQWGQTAYVETKSSNLHLRNTAGMNGKVLAKYPNGTKLAVIGEKGDWYHVIVKDRTGWMHKRYVRLEKK